MTKALVLLLSLAPLAALAAEGNATDADWATGNVISGGDFRECSGSPLPNGWTSVFPNPSLAPVFKVETNANGRTDLLAMGDGKAECFGYVRQKVHLEAGKTYRFRVQLTTEGLDDLNRHLVHGVFGSFNDGIFTYQKQGDEVIGENRFAGPKKTGMAEVRLCFRFSPNGKVRWERVSLQECEPIPPRMVKVACSWGRGDLTHWNEWLDKAGEKKADLALLPEIFNGKTPKDPEILNGPSGTLMAQKAKQWHMYVTGSYYEKRDGKIFNTAPLFDRQGKLIGTYSKMELYDPEETEGVTPGTELPVFDTDFGKLGIMICYDSWFPEVTRLLAYKGAELVVLPNVGYFMGLLPARAADNGVCIAVSSQGNPAGIWDSGGGMAGEKEPDPTRRTTSMIFDYQRDEQAQMVVASLDLSRRFSPAWHEGPMNSAPGGRRVRSTLIRPLGDEIAGEARRWWIEPEGNAKVVSPGLNDQ